MCKGMQKNAGCAPKCYCTKANIVILEAGDKFLSEPCARSRAALRPVSAHSVSKIGLHEPFSQFGPQDGFEVIKVIH